MRVERRGDEPDVGQKRLARPGLHVGKQSLGGEHGQKGQEGIHARLLRELHRHGRCRHHEGRGKPRPRPSHAAPQEGGRPDQEDPEEDR